MRFRIEKKFAVKIVYHEYLYIVKDELGERIFTCTDEEQAKRVRAKLESEYVKCPKPRRKTRRKRA